MMRRAAAVGVGLAILGLTGVGAYALSRKKRIVSRYPIGDYAPVDFIQITRIMHPTFDGRNYRIKFLNQQTGLIDMVDSKTPYSTLTDIPSVMTPILAANKINRTQLDALYSRIFEPGTTTVSPVRAGEIPTWAYAQMSAACTVPPARPPTHLILGQTTPTDYALITNHPTTGMFEIIYFDKMLGAISLMSIPFNPSVSNDTNIRAIYAMNIPGMYIAGRIDANLYHCLMQQMRALYPVVV